MQLRTLTLQPYQLVMAFLAQLQLPAVLAQQLLVVAVNLLNGLANLGSIHGAIRSLALLAPLYLAWCRYPHFPGLRT